ncbi:MAG: phage terminase small subunit P27 family, partial [Marivivens sp.]|nr:phage terminase small subunit P27 family [Marivivens sp.]
ATMGRNPKPTKELKLAGTYDESRHGKRRALKHGSGKMAEMPPSLVGRAADEWDWLCGILDFDIVQEADRALLSSYCIAVQFMEDSYKRVVSDGDIIEGSHDQPRRHPSITTYKQAVEVISMVSSRFGFSPVDRTKVGSELGNDRNDVAEMLADIAKRRAGNQ